MNSTKSNIAIQEKQPLSNLQLTLLNLYDSNVAEEDLKAIQRLIARYFAEKATALANQDYEEKGYSAETFLNENIRSKGKTSSK